MPAESLRFPNTGEDFSGLYAACRWLDANGYSYGSTQRDYPIGILYGRWTIAKWRLLLPSERAALDGTITFEGGSARDGVAVVTLREAPRG